MGPCPLGEVPERPKGSDCKSDGNAFAGSNPARPTTSGAGQVPPKRRQVMTQRVMIQSSWLRRRSGVDRHLEPTPSGRSSMVERQPSKLYTWVRFPSPAPPHCDVETAPPCKRERLLQADSDWAANVLSDRARSLLL